MADQLTTDERVDRINAIIAKENAYKEKQRQNSVLANDPWYYPTPTVLEILELISEWYEASTTGSYELIISAKVMTTEGEKKIKFTDTYWPDPEERISDVIYEDIDAKP